MRRQYKIDDATTLQGSPPLKRLQENLHDLIIVSFEAFTQTRGLCLSLTKLHYVSDEKHEGRFSMHFDALVRAQGLADAIPLSLSFNVKMGDYECYPHL